ncbi:DUF2062 domain-containing protein [Chitinilyticum piscinae]|uniref:DUF2062 domain-containing protein n=1 Tax=Chitinilyticum piscinae TaxID=2866724 RepID=A0A8J7K957_9NEIS|nr:DUF2062 domain-containing protein [Chitinilyticum piscinae]MBE9610678.1 DUF2062 domain-containing protein [Chitinilyticum piscinae]
MPRKLLRRYLPEPHAVREHRLLRCFGSKLGHPDLWHLHRRCVARGVAVGFLSGLIPGPLQMLTAALLSLGWRSNLPVALLVTFYTNPLTIGPIYWVAYKLGSFLLGGNGNGVVQQPMPDFSFGAPLAWLSAMLDWMIGLGPALLVGLPVLATLLAIGGYFAVELFWRGWIVVRRRKSNARLRV